MLQLNRKLYQHVPELGTPGYHFSIGVDQEAFALVIFVTGFIPQDADGMTMIQHIIQRKPLPLILKTYTLRPANLAYPDSRIQTNMKTFF